MLTGLDKIKQDKLDKLKNIRSKGINPYPASSNRDSSLVFVQQSFDELVRLKKEVSIAGRVMAKREHGSLTFCVLSDGTEKLQLFLKKDKIGDEDYSFFIDNIEVGDFVDAKGVLFITKRGERSLEIATYKILGKSLLPLPEKWHGLVDVDERYRKRYLDILMDEDVKNKFIKRSKIIKSIREFLDKEGFLEVETPILQTLAGGALAKPFETRLNALKLDLYLRVAPELYLKRLLVGGFERVYEIGRCFRNEGMDATHNPDFTMLECYVAYQDYNYIMDMTEKMLEFIIKNINDGSLEIEYGKEDGKKEKLNFKSPYPRVEFNKLLKDYTGIDYDSLSEDELFKKAKELGVDVKNGSNKGKIADEIYKDLVRPKIRQPIFIINHPIELSPLAKKMESNSMKVERCQLVVAGFEVTNAFSELNDPQDQFERFKEQEKNAEKGDEETQKMDMDFIEALEYGMPPAAGIGIGIERLTALLTNSHHLREVILFPTMRPKREDKNSMPSNGNLI
ncbi:MAG: lysine--tRNA ligase [Patescibacteria group bacterium]